MQIVLLQQTKPGARPAGQDTSTTKQQHLVVFSIQPSSQQVSVSRFAQMQHNLPSTMQQASEPPGELHPKPQQYAKNNQQVVLSSSSSSFSCGGRFSVPSRSKFPPHINGPQPQPGVLLGGISPWNKLQQHLIVAAMHPSPSQQCADLQVPAQQQTSPMARQQPFSRGLMQPHPA